jgi:hypothetical protein
MADTDNFNDTLTYSGFWEIRNPGLSLRTTALTPTAERSGFTAAAIMGMHNDG